MRTRTPFVLACAALLALACQDTPTDPVEQPVTTAPEFNFMNGPDEAGVVIRYQDSYALLDIFPGQLAYGFVHVGIELGVECLDGRHAQVRSLREELLPYRDRVGVGQVQFVAVLAGVEEPDEGPEELERAALHAALGPQREIRQQHEGRRHRQQQSLRQPFPGFLVVGTAHHQHGLDPAIRLVFSEDLEEPGS